MTDSLFPEHHQPGATSASHEQVQYLPWQWRLLRAVSLVLVPALAAGLTYLLHAKWYSLPTLLAVAILIALPAGTFAIAMWLRSRDASNFYAKLAGMVTLYCFVCDIAALTDMFDVTPSTFPLFATSAFAFLMACALQSRWLLAIALTFIAALVTIWICGDVCTYLLYVISMPDSDYYFTVIPDIFIPAGLLLFFASVMLPLNRFPGFAALFRTFAMVTIFLAFLMFPSVNSHYDPQYVQYTYLGFPIKMAEAVIAVIGLLTCGLAIRLGLRWHWPEAVNTGIVFLVIFLFEDMALWYRDFFQASLVLLLIASIVVAPAVMIYLRTTTWKTVLIVVLLAVFLCLGMWFYSSFQHRESKLQDCAVLGALILFFFLLVMPFRRPRRHLRSTSSLHQRQFVLAGIVLIVLTNALVLSEALWNRIGTSDSVLHLTDRELIGPESHHYGDLDPMPFGLNWRYPILQHPGQELDLNPRGAAWLNDAKLVELGFAMPPPKEPDHSGKEVPKEPDIYERKVPRPIAKEVFLVLEFEGAAWHKALERAAQLDARDQAIEKKLQESANGENIPPAVESDSKLFRQQHIESRLFMVDAGTDQEVLRTKYPDRQHYSIVRGMVQPKWTSVPVIDENPDFSSSGNILGLSVRYMGPPSALKNACHETQPVNGERPMIFGSSWGSVIAPCTATIAFGKRLEPWIVDAAAK